MAKSKTAPIDLSQFVSVAEAANATGYSQQHVRLLAKTGSIEARKLNKWTWLIDLPSLKEYRRSHEDDLRSKRTRL
jgi:hypothetical protein